MNFRFAKRRKKKKNIRWKFFLVVFLFLAFAGGAVYVIFFLPYFKINQIKIEGVQKISSEQIRSRTQELMNKKWLKIMPQDTYFSFSTEQLEYALKDNYAEIKQVNVNKKMPASLAIYIVERVGVMNYCHSNQCFHLDEEGVAFESTPEIYGGLSVCLKDNSNREIQLKDKAIEKEMVTFLITASKLLSEKVNLSLLNFEINSYPTTEVTAITSEDWKIFFEIIRDPIEQVTALKRVLEEKIGEQRDNLEYIDLRVGNRVYYKMKN